MPAPLRRFNRRHAIGLAGLGAAAAAGAAVAVAELGGPTRQAQVAHLLRRAGFAPSQAELTAAVQAGIPASIDTLLAPQKVDDAALETALAGQSFDFTKVADLRRWWLTRMAMTKRPLVEKMTFFWHGLLTSSVAKAGKGDLLYVQNQFLRANALGSLRGLLVGISKDGAMLRWLDGTGSNKAHPNENYAREFMELFTMGVGNYTQADVTAAARAFTGWAVNAQDQVVFRPQAHDAATKTFLGHTGNFGLTDVVDIVLAHPATPKYLAGRLWSFFAYPNPSDADLAPVMDAYRTSNGNIAAMVGAILRSPGFSSPKAYRALVKSPTELIAGFTRQFSLAPAAVETNGGEAMGQALFDPPNVAGWPGGAAWISTGSWLGRMHYLLGRSRAAAAGAPGSLDGLLALMVDGALAPDAHAAIAAHASAGPPAGDLVFLTAATPEYQLA